MHPAAATLFDVHHWIFPATTCDYPVLAVAQDRSALLALGDYTLSFDWGIPDEAQPWLAQDFAPLGQTLHCDLSSLAAVLQATFAGGAEFGLVRFDDELRPVHLELGLAAQREAEAGAEYLIHALGSYRRLDLTSERLILVSRAEQAMLDVGVATFVELATEYGELLRQPLPPRYRSPGRLPPAPAN